MLATNNFIAMLPEMQEKAWLKLTVTRLWPQCRTLMDCEQRSGNPRTCVSTIPHRQTGNIQSK